MNKHRKQLISLLLCLALLFGLAACGAKEVAAAELSAETIKTDVENYITVMAGDDAELTAFTHTQSNLSDTELQAICLANYSGTSASGTGTFTLSYTLENGTWKLKDLIADLNNNATKAPVVEAPAAEASTVEASIADTAPAEDAPMIETPTAEAAPEAAPAETPVAEAPIAEAPVAEAPVAEAPVAEAPVAEAPAAESTSNSGILSGYKLEQVSTFADNNGIRTSYGVLIDQTGLESGTKIISSTGEYFPDVYLSLNDLGGGYFTAKTSEDINSTGLFNQDGEILIPCEAAGIEWIDHYNGTETARYLKVLYSTGETTNEEEAFFYVTSRLLSLGVEEGDIMHKGYAKLYDIENRCFVENFEISKPYRGLYECGDHFALRDSEDVTYFYDYTGTVITQTARCHDVGNGYFTCYDNGSYDVYDETGSLLFSSGDSVYYLNSSSGYLKRYADDGYAILDLSGNQVLPDTYNSVTKETNGFFEVTTKDDEHQVVDVSGKIIVSTAEYITSCAPGYYYYGSSGAYTLACANSTTYSGLEDSPHTGIIMDGTKATILSTGKELELGDEYANRIDFGLVYVQSDSNGKYGVFDLISGQQLLDYQYNEICSVDGYLYARQGDSWTSYKVTKLYN